jgi:hypothetical protein
MPITSPTAVPVSLSEERSSRRLSSPAAFTVDCADCSHRETQVCEDCVVSFIVGREPDEAVVVDAAEARAVRMLEHVGLVPGVRHSSEAS